MYKCTLTRGRDIHNHNTRGRDNLRTEQHKLKMYERIPSQAGVQFFNKFPEPIKNAQMPTSFKKLTTFK